MSISYEEKKLLSRIYYLEDKLLRCKNMYQIETLRQDLSYLRRELQKAERERIKREIIW